MARFEDIKLVLFDLDGTLIDTIELIYQSFNLAVKTVLDLELSRDRLLRNLGRPLLDQMMIFSPLQAEKLVEVYHQHNLANHDRMVSAYPGAEETLAELKNRGLAVGVVTSKRRDIAWRGLKVCLLDGFIDRMVAMEDSNEHKPEPEPVEVILEQFNIDAASTIFIGDSPFDLEAGRRAGTFTIAALWGPFDRRLLMKERPDAEIETLPQLLPLIG